MSLCFQHGPFRRLVFNCGTRAVLVSTFLGLAVPGSHGNVLLRVWRSTSRRKRERGERKDKKKKKQKNEENFGKMKREGRREAGSRSNPLRAKLNRAPLSGPRPRCHQCLSIKIIQIAARFLSVIEIVDGTGMGEFFPAFYSDLISKRHRYRSPKL